MTFPLKIYLLNIHNFSSQSLLCITSIEVNTNLDLINASISALLYFYIRQKQRERQREFNEKQI